MSALQLTGTSSGGSVLLSLAGSVETFSYGPFGATRSRTGSATSAPGFNGERIDSQTGVTHLGCGYRAYSPALHRFTCPDSESPFGAGGINPYVYCASDPINATDPTGHMPVLTITIEALRLIERGVKTWIAEESAKAVTVRGTVRSAELAASEATGTVTAETASRSAVEPAWQSISTGHAANSPLRPAHRERSDFARGNAKQEEWKRVLSSDRVYNKRAGRFVDQECGYIGAFGGKNEPTILIHGYNDGKQVVYRPRSSHGTDGGTGRLVFDAKGFANHLSSLGLDLRGTGPSSSPLHLVACDVHITAFPEELAKALNRPVKTYGRGGPIRCDGGLDSLALWGEDAIEAKHFRRSPTGELEATPDGIPFAITHYP